MSYIERYKFTHAHLWLHTLLSGYPEYDKGQLYVDRFCEACQMLINCGQVNEFFVWKKHSAKDNLGVDVTIKIEDRLVDFSVTSSLNNAINHMGINKNHPERGTIRIVYVREGNRPVMKSVENLGKEILRKANLNFEEIK